MKKHKEQSAAPMSKNTFRHFRSLVLMQLKDKMDMSFVSSKAKTISKVVFLALRIIAVAAISYLFFLYSATLSIFSVGGVVPVSVVAVMYTLIFLLSLISCMIGLMKTLFFADDNRFLVTLPATGNMVFFSKLVVFYIFELMRSLTFTLPLFVGYGMASLVPGYTYVWMFFSMLFLSAAPVVLGALLSMLAMVIYQYLRRHEVLKVVTFMLVIGAFVALIVKLILLIPENINLINQAPWIQKAVADMTVQFSRYALPFLLVTNMMLGKYENLRFTFASESLLIFVCLVAVLAVLLGVVYLIAKPLFFKMTAQPFEFEKKEFVTAKPNLRRKKYKSILRKEFLFNLRSTEISYSFLSVFVAVPVLILLLNKVFAAMSTKLLGQYMTYSFNLLIMLLILLASNAIVSSMYSMEGRAGYMKRTKPIELVMPLLCKLVYNSIFSLVSIAASVGIFGAYSGLAVGNVIMIGISVLTIHYGHMLWSAERDLMNPQNEQYATSSGQIDNPNSNKSTISAFLISFLIFVLSLLLFTENLAIACVKLMILGIVFAAIRAYLFVVKVQVFYREKM